MPNCILRKKNQQVASPLIEVIFSIAIMIALRKELNSLCTVAAFHRDKIHRCRPRSNPLEDFVVALSSLGIYYSSHLQFFFISNVHLLIICILQAFLQMSQCLLWIGLKFHLVDYLMQNNTCCLPAGHESCFPSWTMW